MGGLAAIEGLTGVGDGGGHLASSNSRGALFSWCCVLHCQPLARSKKFDALGKIEARNYYWCPWADQHLAYL